MDSIIEIVPETVAPPSVGVIEAKLRVRDRHEEPATRLLPWVCITLRDDSSDRRGDRVAVQALVALDGQNLLSLANQMPHLRVGVDNHAVEARPNLANILGVDSNATVDSDELHECRRPSNLRLDSERFSHLGGDSGASLEVLEFPRMCLSIMGRLDRYLEGMRFRDRGGTHAVVSSGLECEGFNLSAEPCELYFECEVTRINRMSALGRPNAEFRRYTTLEYPELE
ncbi:MAG: hypothetical protein JRD03_09570, partial [Deltaproteobacteria bacterium]|nr:hypothetical protein [Deltaproteobacteria bacterium]